MEVENETLMAADSAEDELLICCARTSRHPEVAKRIGVLIREGMDWERLLHLARKNRVMPLLYWHLSSSFPNNSFSQAVPMALMAELRTHFQANSFRNLFLARELLAIHRRFEENQVALISYKGPILAASIYGNLALREFIDLDILVHKNDIPRATELLIAQGYSREPHLTQAQEAFFSKTQREYVFTREDGSVVELHWAVTPRVISFPLDPEDLWRRREKVPFGGDTILTFSPEDLLLFLCVHGSKHFWYRLAWICDVAELIRAEKSMDWGQLIERSSQLGAQRMLFLGLVLASDLLGAALPHGVSQVIRTDPAVEPLAEQVRGWLFREAEEVSDIFARGLEEESSFHPFRVKVRERFRDKALYCARTALVPTPEDWELLPLPKTFFPFYYALRPIRLGGRYGQKVLNRWV